MFWYLLSIIFVIISEFNGYKIDVNETPEMITDEKFTTINEFPSSVSIQYCEIYHICTGIILNEYYILTAAHCFDNVIKKESVIKWKIGSYYVVTGTDTITRLKIIGNYHRIEQVFIHKDYLTMANHDMAVIKVLGHISLDVNIRKATEFASLSQLSGGFKCDVAGWGNYKQNHLQMVYSTILRSTTFESLSYNGTASKFKGYSLKRNVNACEGDSGAGAFINNKLVGMVIKGTCKFSQKQRQYTWFINVLSTISQTFIKKILKHSCPKKSMVIINQNVDWDPVLAEYDSPGSVTKVPTTVVRHCTIL